MMVVPAKETVASRRKNTLSLIMISLDLGLFAGERKAENLFLNF